jgi:hypothetical protein
VKTSAGVLDAFRARLDQALEEQGSEAASEARGPTADQVERALKEQTLDFRAHYESWYSETLAVISQVLPDRAADFRHHYKLDRRRTSTTTTL